MRSAHKDTTHRYKSANADFRYTLARSICADALDMLTCVSADLYHIEFERSENISNLPQSKYIESSKATTYRQHKIASVDTEAVLAKKKGRGILAILRPFPVGRYIQFHTALPQAPRALFFICYFPVAKRALSVKALTFAPPIYLRACSEFIKRLAALPCVSSPVTSI